MTLGMPASISTIIEIGAAILRGAISVRKIAVPIPAGTANRTAIADDASVSTPKTRIPKDESAILCIPLVVTTLPFVLGSHAVLVKNPRPFDRTDGYAA